MAHANRELQTLGDIYPLKQEVAPEAVCARVRRVVAAHATGPQDCRLLLEALGVGQRQEDGPDLAADR